MSKPKPTNDLHENELGYFVDTLNPHQRVYLQRLLGEYLTAIPKAGEEAPPEALSLMRQGAGTLFSLLEHLRAFHNNDPDSDIRPFGLSFPEPGHAQVLLSPRILHWSGLWDARSHEWISEIKAGRVSVDLRKLDDINSSTIAWLVTMASHVPSRRLSLLNASERIRRSILVLKLDQVLVAQ
jgi:hypothetical protein